jgi:hypothetical protein
MPKIQWEQLPRERSVYELARWKAQDPDVPDSAWYKDFGTFKLCGTGRFPSTFLLAGQTARGERL